MRANLAAFCAALQEDQSIAAFFNQCPVPVYFKFIGYVYGNSTYVACSSGNDT